MTRPDKSTSPLVFDQTTLHHFQERYPFNEAELELLVRCHEHDESHDSFLVTMATASPYAVSFLPGDSVVDRVVWLQDHVLPTGFANQLRNAVYGDAFCKLAHQGISPALEQFVEGIADATGRRGVKETVRVLYRCGHGSIDPEAAMADLAVRLMAANQLWQSLPQHVPDTKTFDQHFHEYHQPTIDRLTENLRAFTNRQQESRTTSHSTILTERMFVEWAEETFPMLYMSLTVFVNNLLFHGLSHHQEESSVQPSFSLPQPNGPSDILTPGLAMPLAWMDSRLSGTFHRLYSSVHDGQSFNRLEYGLLGYQGPTCVLIHTTSNAVLGAFTNTEWKACRDSGDDKDEAFLFTLQPFLRVYSHVHHEDDPHQKKKQNLWYLYSRELASSSRRHLTFAEGLGWGGTTDLPRLWIPAALTNCHAGGWDATFQVGPLLPDECCEQFEIQCLEVWGVGGDERIASGLARQAVVREQSASTVERARVFRDKREFVGDLQQTLQSNLFQHQEQARGRHEFIVDDNHGGYKIADTEDRK